MDLGQALLRETPSFAQQNHQRTSSNYQPWYLSAPVYSQLQTGTVSSLPPLPMTEQIDDVPAAKSGYTGQSEEEPERRHRRRNKHQHYLDLSAYIDEHILKMVLIIIAIIIVAYMLYELARIGNIVTGIANWLCSSHKT